MKTMHTFVTCTVLTFFLIQAPLTLSAQAEDAATKAELLSKQKAELAKEKEQYAIQKARMEKHKERIESQRIAFITNQLDLTPSEAQTFWPVYNEYEKKRHEVTKDFRKKMNLEERNIEELSDKEAMEAAENQLLEAQKMLELRKEYHLKFKNMLPPKKILMLYDSEREFQKQLIERLREERESRRGGEQKGNHKRPGKRY